MADGFLGVRTVYGAPASGVVAFIPTVTSDVGDGAIATLWHTALSKSPLIVFDKLTRLFEALSEAGTDHGITPSNYTMLSLEGDENKTQARLTRQTPFYAFGPETVALVYSGTFFFGREGASGIYRATGDLLLNRALEVLKF